MMVKEIFIPKIRITITDDADIDKFIALYNGKKNIYQSVYSYVGEPIAPNAYIDKIFLDFDYDTDLKFYDDVRKVAFYLYDLGVKFYIRFSGRGFHIFILTYNEQLKQPKLAIKKWVKDLHRRTNTYSDPSVVGDTRRVSRILGTKNLKTGLYCIPIEYHQLCELSYEDICQMAKSYNGHADYIIGQDYVSLLPLDEDIITTKHEIVLNDVHFSAKFPPCIDYLLSNADLGYHERRELIIYLRDDGYTEEEVVEILRNHLSDEKFQHCVEEEHQVSYLFGREDILFSSCESQKCNGICNSSDCCGANLYL